MRKIVTRRNFFRNQALCVLAMLGCFNFDAASQYLAASKPLATPRNIASVMEIGKPFSEAVKFNSLKDTFETELKTGPFIDESKNSRWKSADEMVFLAPIYFGEIAQPYISSSLKHESKLNAVPLSLKSFNSGFENLKPALNWVATVEDNLNYYAVQRSIDGVDFQDIAYVFPEGVQLVDSKYSYVDNEIPVGTIGVIYYRLMLKDSDGAEAFSGTKRLYLGLGDRNTLGGINFNGNVKVLSYQVRTPQRPEFELQEDPHPRPSSDNKKSVLKVWDAYKTQVKEKVKSIWSFNN